MWTRLIRLIGLYLLFLAVQPVQSQITITDICPANPLQQRGGNFEPGGIILSAFDNESLWVYDIERDTRYPLPQTRPCGSNCHLAPDAQWLSYLNPDTGIFNKMRLDGTQRTPLVSGAADVDWWNESILRVWTPDGRLYLRAEGGTPDDIELLAGAGVRALQPSGRHALAITDDDRTFWRELIDLTNVNVPQRLAPDTPYFNAAAWSPDGRYLAYIAGTGESGAELWFVAPGDVPQRLTDFSASGQWVRINGYAPGDLSWSPDGRQIAFWAVDLNSTDPENDTGNATLYLVDIDRGLLQRYCGYTTIEHTPITPRLVWSPDGSHIAFAGNVPGDNKGSLLLALNIESGIFTELSNGLYPVFGIPQVTAWGTLP